MGRRNGRLPRVLDADEQSALLAELNARYWTPHRDRTAVLVMLDAGLRVGETVALELDHVDLTTRKLTVRNGKGGVDRVVPLTPRLSDAVDSWMDRRADGLKDDTRFVFPSRVGNRLHANQLRRSVKRAARNAELPESDRISPHTMRHTFAVDLLRHTGRLEIVRDALGHASIQTTEIYARLVNGEVEDAVATFRMDDGATDDGGRGVDLEWLIAEADPDELRTALMAAMDG